MPDVVDFYAFCQAAFMTLETARKSFRDNGGFNNRDMAKMQTLFQKYDDDSSGVISGTEMVNLVETEFSAIARDPNQRPTLLEMLREIDDDGVGMLDFTEFLRFMRQCNDLKNQIAVTKEMRALEATRFTPLEAQGFRELFQSVDEAPPPPSQAEQQRVGGASDSSQIRVISFDQVKELLGRIAPMGEKNAAQLWRVYTALARDVRGDDELDFPEFLYLIRALIDVNFAGIADRFVGAET